VIETANHRLEPVREDHAVLVYTSLRDPQLYALIPEEPPASLEALAKRYAFLQSGKSPDGKEHWLNWIIRDRRTKKPVGTFQATVRDEAPSDIAYMVFPAHWRQGIASEAGAAVIDHLFSRYPTPMLAANLDTHNIASMKLVETLGFKRTAFIPKADTFKGMSSDEFRYELPRQSWNPAGR
jgi:ribosomal-protein-alanine N-acetyltransferase